MLKEFAVEYKDFWLTIHLLAMVLGLGGATYTDVLLVSFLKDFKIDSKEKEVITTMSKAVMWGVFFALVSGAMLFFSDIERLSSSTKFLAKVIIFIILMINGFLLHKIILPKLLRFNFNRDHFLVKKFLHLRHAGFIMGAISGVSWYTIFILGTLSHLEYEIWQILVVYFLLVLLAVIAALFVEKRIRNRVKN